MSLAAGTRFGSYEVTSLLGSGGMGEVYRARDTSLKRDVAIKVLPTSLSADADRLARFQREAEILASLNHPNIAQIYGLERGESSTALALELVEGPTLAERIAQGPLPPDDALTIAGQIADALEAAHARSIVHRDLKPANIKLAPDGTVKVLDFGLAKAFDSPVASGPRPAALTTPAMTEAGIVLGTAAYMSPEQARGKLVDQRTDIWAFGCVLYEMLTGQPAFLAADVTSTLARVLEREPELQRLPAALTPAVRSTIALCLQKDARQRCADIRDVRLALAGRFESVRESGSRAERSMLRRALPVAAAVLVTGVAASTIALRFWPAPEPHAVRRFAYLLPEDQLFLGNDVVAVSPDGHAFAYSTDSGLYIRAMDELDARLLPGIREAVGPFFSPDGRSVAFFTGEGPKRVAITGGAPVAVGQGIASNPLGASWAKDGTVFYATGLEGVYRAPEAGGTSELVVPAHGQFLRGPELLPDGDSLLFTVAADPNSWDEAEIVAQSLATGARTVLIRGGSDARYVPTGHLVYARGDELLAVAFDPATKTVEGSPTAVLRGISPAPSANRGAANYGISDDGTLVYAARDGEALKRSVVWVDRAGREEPVGVEPGAYAYAQLSPDGKRIALDRVDATNERGNDVWIFEPERAALQRLTFDHTYWLRNPVWSPDGQRIAFTKQVGDSTEVYWQAADGSGMASPLTRGSTPPGVFPSAFSPDGATLLYQALGRDRDVLAAAVADPAAAGAPLWTSPSQEYNATVSPDGRWLAYMRETTDGRSDVFVRPYQDVDAGLWQISSDGGSLPRWSRDGKELFYVVEGGQSSTLMAVEIEPGPSFKAGAPKALFSGPYLRGGAGRGSYDVSVDGRRFLMIKRMGEPRAARRRIVVVENWFEELERLVPTG